MMPSAYAMLDDQGKHDVRSYAVTHSAQAWGAAYEKAKAIWANAEIALDSRTKRGDFIPCERVALVCYGVQRKHFKCPCKICAN